MRDHPRPGLPNGQSALFEELGDLAPGLPARALIPLACPLYHHPADSCRRAYQYLRNVGGTASAELLLRKALGLRGKLPDGLEEVTRLMFAGAPGFCEIKPGLWAIEVTEVALADVAAGRFVVFDLETTGGKPPHERITEIGAVRIANGRIVETFKTFVNPGKPIPPFVARLTGITNRDVRHAPKIEEVMPEFLDFIRGHILVAHDVFQDLRFIDQELFLAYGGILALPVLDTLVLAKELIAPEVGYSLRRVAEHLELELETAHRALDDARLTAELFLEFLRRKGPGAARGMLSGYEFNSGPLREPDPV